MDKGKTMKNKQTSTSKILDFWAAVEQFTPCTVEPEKKTGYVKSIQREVLGKQDIPWLNKDSFNHERTDKFTWVYTVFLGILKKKDITKQIKQFLRIDHPDYDLKKENGLSCICAFQLDINGKPISSTFEVPDYFIGMSCLTQFKEKPNTWLEQAPEFKRKFTDAFSNLCDRLNQTEPFKPLDYEELSGFIRDLIGLSKWNNLTKQNLIINKAIIYSSKLPIPKKQQKEEIKNSNTMIINSFYLDELRKVKESLEMGKINVGEGFKEYMGMYNSNRKEDFRKDIHLLKKYMSPKYLPPARWPSTGDHSLSLAQQVAVNLAVSKKSGLFSVNGPPGTGKTTLLKDILSHVVLERAKIIFQFEDPNNIFEGSSTFQIMNYNYKTWKLKPSLLGHEVVVASSNNGAVENISKEIPRQTEIDSKWELDYFSEIASYVMNEKSWGLGAAVLGNNKNRSEFFNRFWNKEPDTRENVNKDSSFGLKYLLGNICPKSNWNDARKNFSKTLNAYEAIQAELVKLEEIIKNTPEQNQNIQNLEKKTFQLQTEVEEYNSLLVKAKNKLQALEKVIENEKLLLNSHSQLKPTKLALLIEFITRSQSHKIWQTQYASILNNLSTDIKISRDINEEIEGLKSRIDKSQQIIDSDITLLHTLKEKSRVEQELLLKYKTSMGDNFPDNDFWKQPEDQLHKCSPWIFDELHFIRGQLFVDAIELHKSLIINLSDKIMNNLRCMSMIMTSRSWPEEKNSLLPSIWASFFMVVPLVSTTFASFANLFKGMSKESIGWLLIDEAGQAAPQLAASAINRARRSIVVGDPLQIKPVVTIPYAMNDALMSYHTICAKWNPLEESVQTLADRVNPYGTYIGKSEEKKWVGAPLRVHRRCNAPMFNIANEIAYDGLMIQATYNKQSEIEKIFSESKWFHVEGTYADGNWIIDEGKVVMHLLSIMTSATHSLPSLYVISPFNAVAFKMKQYLLYNIDKWCNSFSIKKSMIRDWVNKSIGTIHTFQGKQAEITILLLGGNSDKPGAINWASSSPNILNVGITRAKNLVFVVGNHKLWSKKPYFQNLNNYISVNEEFCVVANVLEEHNHLQDYHDKEYQELTNTLH